MDLSSEIALLMERSRPVSDYPNTTVSASGHNCDLPVFAGLPVSLDPRTYRRAEDTDLIVHCTDCGALWGVQLRKHVVFNGPDLIWVEKRPVTSRGRSALRRRAVAFSAITAYRTPDPHSIDWSDISSIPLKRSGLRWYQIEFPEMLSNETNRCTSPECLLRIDHGGLHESFSAVHGVVAWS